MTKNTCNKCFIRQLTTPFGNAKNALNAPNYDNGVTKPMMGWSSWNCFHNQIDEKQILEIADALVKTGLADKGYRFVNLDDNWHSSMRDADGNLQGDLIRFPRGIPALIKDINAKGLKAGIYSSNGTLTCEDLPASLGNEEKDAYTVAKWGAEFLKYDFCHHKAYPKEAPLISAVELMKLDNHAIKLTLVAGDATLGGKAQRVADEKMPCGSYVKGLDANKGIIVFEDVEVPEEGEYAMNVTTKKCGQYEKFFVAEVNLDDVHVTVPGCKKFNDTARVQAVIRLKKGKNVIKIYNPVECKSDGYVFQYRYMGKMLKKATKRVASETQTAEKPITYSICEWGFNRPYKWGASAGNQWRTTPDIKPWWPWIKLIYGHTVKLYGYAAKGCYNDPDMLEVGNGKLTYEQNKTHFTLWAMMNAPLVLGNDIRKFVTADGKVDEDNPVLKILKNEKIIALDQDEKSKPCKRLVRGTVDVLAKPLSDGTAFCFFNRSGRKKAYKINLKKFCSDGYIEFADKAEYSGEELWSGEKITTDGKIKAVIPPHGVVVYRFRA